MRVPGIQVPVVQSAATHATAPVAASTAPNPVSEFCRKQSPARYSVTSRLDALGFVSSTSVRYDSSPTTYESVSTMRSPVVPKSTVVTIWNGSPAVPLPDTPDWLTGVKAVLGPAPPPAGMFD